MTEDHKIFQDQIAEYLSNGLTPDERVSLEAHLATCDDCARKLSDLQKLESDMTALFAATQPDSLFESRLVSRFRFGNTRFIHPLVRKAAVAVAASVLLAGFGYVANQRINNGTMPTFAFGENANRVKSASNLREVGQAILSSANDDKGAYAADLPAADKAMRFAGTNRGDLKVKQNLSYGDRTPDFDRAPDFNISQNNARLPGLAGGQSGSAVRGLSINNHDEDLKGTYINGSTAPLQASAMLFRTQTDQEQLGRPLAPAKFGAGEYFSLGDFVGKDKGVALGIKLNSAAPESVAAGVAVAGKPINRSPADSNDAVLLPTEKDAVAKTDPSLQVAQGIEGRPAGNPATPEPAPQEVQIATMQSKIIRNGEIEFEVDSFDSSAATVSKIVNEETGYIATTNSEKLPNGKVRGTLVVRVKPDHLDTLVLKLRGLGELKRQNLTANDVTKQYYDIASELRAAHAMQERLLEIIKSGNAQVKDLLNVEKELATWRGKIEKLEGEIRYYDSLVSLSTLTISLQERDIRTASAIKETEQADAGIEVSDVETARSSAIKAVEEAKGRIIEAELKKFDAGQFAAKVVADVPAESAGAVIDRLKQIGKVARLEITRKQTTPDNTTPLPGAKIEKGDTRIIASFYNLANIAPRQTVTMQLACDDVSKTYAATLAQIEKAGGRVVTSNLQQPKPGETSGTIQFELPANAADAGLMQIQQAGTSLQLTVSENPDTANVTAAKRGFNLSLIGADTIPPRQAVNITSEVSDVIAASGSIQTVAESLGGKIVDTNQNTSSNSGSRGTLRIELPSGKLPELLSKIESTTKIRSQQSVVRSEIPNGPTARAQVELNLATPDTLVNADSGFGASLRKGFATSIAGLLWSLQLIIIGLCLVAPWAILLWTGVKFWKRKRVVPAS